MQFVLLVAAYLKNTVETEPDTRLAAAPCSSLPHVQAHRQIGNNWASELG